MINDIEMKPVAYMRPSTEGYDSAFRDAHTVESSVNGDWSEWIPLFTADQLRAAQVAVLREVSAEYGETKEYPGACLRLADKLESTEPILRNPDEVSCTPRTPR